jgi:tetratricopeptide (TPR) repeat protein
MIQKCTDLISILLVTVMISWLFCRPALSKDQADVSPGATQPGIVVNAIPTPQTDREFDPNAKSKEEFDIGENHVKAFAYDAPTMPHELLYAFLVTSASNDPYWVTLGIAKAGTEILRAGGTIKKEEIAYKFECFDRNSIGMINMFGRPAAPKYDESKSMAVELIKKYKLSEKKASSLTQRGSGPTTPETSGSSSVHKRAFEDSDEGREWRQYMDAGTAARHSGNSVAAIMNFQAALKLAENNQPESSATTMSLSSLGEAYLYAGAYQKAEDTFERALPLAKKFFTGKMDLAPMLQRYLEAAKAKQRP